MNKNVSCSESWDMVIVFLGEFVCAIVTGVCDGIFKCNIWKSIFGKELSVIEVHCKGDQ